MKKLMNWGAIALLGFTLAGTVVVNASTEDVPNVEAQQKGQRPKGKQKKGSSGVDRQQFSQNRMDAIAKAANLTEEEKALVMTELKKYDDIRMQTWVETRKIHDEIAQLGDKATDKHYRDALQKISELNAKRQRANQDFLSSLTQKLSPKKVYLVHRSHRSFNANTGKKLRQS